MYVALPEVLTEHYLFGSPEFPDCVNASPLYGLGDLQFREQDTPLLSAGSKLRILKVTA